MPVLHTGGRRLAHVDFGGPGTPLLALHGTFGRGTEFAGPAGAFDDAVRVVAPDQQGHGHSDPAPVTRAAFVADAAALLRHRDLGPLPVLGHSLGGIAAHQQAAAHPGLVSALVVADVGPLMRRPEVEHPVLDVRGRPRGAASRAGSAAAIVARGVPSAEYFPRSAEDTPDGCRLLFDWADMVTVQAHGVGDLTADWLASDCPALVLRGGDSPCCPRGLPRRRPPATPGPGCGSSRARGTGCTTTPRRRSPRPS